VQVRILPAAKFQKKGGNMKKIEMMSKKEIKAFWRVNHTQNLMMACKWPFWLKAWFASRYEKQNSIFMRMLKKNHGINPGENVSIKIDCSISYDDGVTEKPKRKAK
jgi:hypothetical protein